ncbi:MAG: DUF5106 domain-containing protein [Bacteroidales bacterium]|nr:DUF5106 domain-containing protein [Bacteroidales bacterium]
MKRTTLLTILTLCSLAAVAQPRKITFVAESATDSVMYIALHHRDRYILIDSAVRYGNNYTFAGDALNRGIYALLAQDRSTLHTDFTVDGKQRFSIKCGQGFKAADMKVKGCKANKAMFDYIAKLEWAKQRAQQINEMRKSADPAVKDKANNDFKELSDEMNAYEKRAFDQGDRFYFFSLIKMFADPEVPDTLSDKLSYYLTHYWDKVDFSDRNLVYTPNLYNKLNYYFFGAMYYSSYDTLVKYADTLLDRLVDDTLMLRYTLDHIMPRYYRSTKNIGWDALWCHLVRRYYLEGKCPWATEGDLTYKRRQAAYLEKSLIGAMGEELYMADTNQSIDPSDWISSHRFPERYVILWFWDPDCHHCQEQTATLKTLYDSLLTAPDRRFEVYAVGYESDTEKWLDYVRDHQLPFVNVGGANVNIDYQEAYNVHGAPTMIILNADRRIIMNKVLPTKSILPFLDEYERLHPEQATRQPSRWQRMGAAIKQNNAQKH